jgi:hypothetical protein
MRQQILKGITMFMLVVAVAFMTAVPSANGQSSSTITATVPFEFKVGDKALPAGVYTVRTMSVTGEALAISNRESNRSAIRLTNAVHAPKASSKGKLVFHRYGQNYFLSEVWCGGDSTGRQLLKSKQERTMESQLAAISSKSELAGNNYETIEIVAMVR